MRFADSRILIFAKPPVAGAVKTRLFPVLSPAAAARLHSRMLYSVVRRVGDAQIAPTELYCAGDIDHPVFVDLARRHDLVRRPQVGVDLGERMGQAARSTLRTHARAVLIGTDCPGLDGDYLDRLINGLSIDCPVVVGPAEDGGYVALGLSRYDPRLFGRIDWGSDRVLAQTRQRLQKLGWPYRLMPSLWDVDRPDDFDRLKSLYPEIALDRAVPAEPGVQALARE